MFFYYKYTFCGPKWWVQKSQRQAVMQNKTILARHTHETAYFVRAKQPMRIQLDKCDNVGQISELRIYCVILVSSKSVSLCIDSILTE